MARAPWRIRHELFWATLFARFAGEGEPSIDRTELHADLARLYFELAAAHRAAGNSMASGVADQKGQKHALLAEPPDPPRAAAMAMAVPPSYDRTDARGIVVPDGPEDEGS